MSEDNNNHTDEAQPRPGSRVILLALNDRLRRSQTSLLQAYGHTVATCTTIEELRAVDDGRADCLTVNLQGTGMSPSDCLRNIRARDMKLPVIMLSNPFSYNDLYGAKPVESSVDGPAFLLWQPVDIELYLTLINSVAERS